MRLALFLPLTYLAGVQGFIIFAPYMCVFLVLAHIIRRRKMIVIGSVA